MSTGNEPGSTRRIPAMLTITPSMDDVFPGFLQSGHPNTRSLTTVILKHVLNKKKNGMGVLGFFYPGTITEFSELYCISELWNFKVMKFYIFDRLFICVYCSLEYWIWYHVYTAWFVSLCRRTIASTNIAPDKYHPNILKVYTCISRTCTVVHDFCNLYIDFWHKCFAISSIYNTGK